MLNKVGDYWAKTVHCTGIMFRLLSSCSFNYLIFPSLLRAESKGHAGFWGKGWRILDAHGCLLMMIWLLWNKRPSAYISCFWDVFSNKLPLSLSLCTQEISLQIGSFFDFQLELELSFRHFYHHNIRLPYFHYVPFPFKILSWDLTWRPI